MSSSGKHPDKGPGPGAASAGTESVASFSDEDLHEPPDVSTLPPGTRVADRYAILSILGRGGYAVVYLARDEATGTNVALKVLKANRVSLAGRRRMARESEAALQFDHERLVRVLDSGSAGDIVFLAMEVVDGGTLRDRLSAGPMPTHDVVRIASDVLAGLAALHRRGIVHRDVKPSNILLDGQGRAKLADFGLVTRWNDDQSRATQSHAIVGTLEYVSPEQALGENLDGRSDLYAMGVVIFEMLSGQPPHGSRSSLGTLVAHLTKPAPDVRLSGESVPEWLAVVVARLLAKSRDERYPNAEAVLADLHSQSPARLSQVSRTRWRAAGAAAGLAVCALLFLAWRARPSARPNPASLNVHNAEVRSGVLRALDNKGAVLWAHAMGVPLDDKAFAPGGATGAPRLRVADLEGDGQNEILIVAESTPNGLLELHAFNADGSERFRRRPGRPLTFGTKQFEGFTGNSVHFFIDDKGRRRLFFLSSHRPWFPSVLEELDPQGRLVSEFVAAGSQISLTRQKFKGRDALAMTGFHNETRGGSVIILDLDNPSGHAPAKDPAFTCMNCRDGAPLTILVAPRSDVLPVASGAEGAVAIGTVIVIDKGVVDFAATHAPFREVDGTFDTAVVAYSIAPDFSRVVDVRPSESLKILHDRFFKEGRLNHRFGPRDEAEIRRVVTWDGKDWTPIPHN